VKYMRVRFSSIFLMNLLTEGNEIHARIKKGLPPGAKFCYSIPTTDYIFIDFVFEHPNFQVVMMGHEIPLFDGIEIQKLYPS